MLVSTFELLVKPIAPGGAGPAALARTIVQGYFLTIANTSATQATLRLTFTATTPTLNLADTVVIRDVTGANVFGELVPTADPKRLTYSIRIPAHDTALVILQPDVTLPAVVAAANLEVRGYVEIAATGFGSNRFDLLLTPEHRGTFFSGNPAAPTEIDQLVYTLPTALGRAQYTVAQRPLIRDILDLGITPVGITDVAVRPDEVVVPGLTPNLQSVLLAMAQQIEELEARQVQDGSEGVRSLGNGQALSPIGSAN